MRVGLASFLYTPLRDVLKAAKGAACSVGTELVSADVESPTCQSPPLAYVKRSAICPLSGSPSVPIVSATRTMAIGL